MRHTEVALLRLEAGPVRSVFPEHLRITGSIPLSSKAWRLHRARQEAEINNFARVKHATIFETIMPEDNGGVAAPHAIQ